MTFLEALRQARARLATRPKHEYGGVRPLISPYICDALHFVYRANGAKGEDFRSRIHAQLAGHFGYEGWLQNYRQDVFREMVRITLETDRDPFQEGRLAWLDHMIAEEAAS